MAIFREVVRGDGSGIAEYYRVIDGKVVNVDYNVSINKPTINGQELVGDLNLAELMEKEGFVRFESDPTVPEHVKYIKASDIEKWQNGVTLEQVAQMIGENIGGVASFNMIPVDVLPTANIQPNVIYAIPAAKPKNKNSRDEYVYINGGWECIGSTAIDLDNYYTKAEIDAKLDALNDGMGAANEELELIINGGA